MLNKKAYLNFYTPMDGDGLARSLEKQAHKGWHLTKYGDLMLHFEKGEPKDTHYAVTFFPDATLYDPKMPEEQETYVDMCAAAGWELVEAKGPMQLFRTDRPDPIPIETDESYKLQSVHTSMKKTFLWSRILLIFSMGLQLMTQWQNFQFNAFSMIASNTSLSIVFALLSLFLYLILDLGCYFLWYSRSKAAVAKGQPCANAMTGLRKDMLWVPLLATVAMTAILIIDAPSTGARVYYAGILLCTFAIIALVTGLQKYFKKLGWPAKKTRNTTMAVAVILALALCGGMVWFIMAFDLSPSLDEQMDEIITLPDPMLTLEDLMPGPDDAANWHTHQIKRSILATYTTYTEHDSDASLDYRLVEIKWDGLRELAFETMADRNHFINTDHARTDHRWNADRAYARSTYNGEEEYMMLYDDAILYIHTGVVLDEALIAQIEQALID
ncbi:MAG: DUF2812 domain-containing protein [Clostridia bacterium]|nr:DUF2812 domain-containing protein [Clostridia bacterium]